MNISKQVVILSATKNGDTVENTNFRNNTMRGVLGDMRLPFNEGMGVYKGQAAEVSFVVVVNDAQDIENLKILAFKMFDQESVLIQDSNQEAFLVFNDGSTQNLGRLEQVNKDTALSMDAYTIMNDVYYAIPSPSRLA